MDIHSEVHSWLWAMEGTCCLLRPMCGNQLEKKLAKQLLFVCLSELPSKQSRWERSQRPLPGKMRKRRKGVITSAPLGQPD